MNEALEPFPKGVCSQGITGIVGITPHFNLTFWLWAFFVIFFLVQQPEMQKSFSASSVRWMWRAAWRSHLSYLFHEETEAKIVSIYQLRIQQDYWSTQGKKVEIDEAF